MTEREALGEEKIQERLEELEIWGLQFDRLATEVEFDSYKEAVFFANTMFSLAEEEFHHPKVTVKYGAVEIDLYTHEVKGVTEADFEVARKIEERLSSMDWD